MVRPYTQLPSRPIPNLFKAVSAIVVAMEMISDFCKKLKFKKRIIMVTNGDMPMDLDADMIEQIGKRLQEQSIELTILCVQVNPYCALSIANSLPSGVDFDDVDDEDGYHEDGKSDVKVCHFGGLQVRPRLTSSSARTRLLSES